MTFILKIEDIQKQAIINIDYSISLINLFDGMKDAKRLNFLHYH